MRKLLCIVLLILLAGPFALVASERNRSGRERDKRVLVISSYHALYQWTNDVLGGIFSVFRDSPYEVEVDTIELDALRIPEPHIRNRIFQSHLSAMLANARYDVVMMVDADAVIAVKNNLAMFPPGTQMVFCGLSPGAVEITRALPQVTGVVQPMAISRMIRLGLSLLPHTRKVAVLTDGSSAGVLLGDELRQSLATEFPRMDLEVLNGKQLTTGEMLLRLSRLPADSFVVMAAWKHGRGERFAHRNELRKQLMMNSRGPIFCADESMIRNQVAVGGIVMPGFEHGREAARLAERVMDGIDAADIPVITGSNRLMFNYKLLNANKIRMADLPGSVQLLNMPESLLHRYWQYFIWMLIAAGALVVLLAGLGGYMMLYRRADRRRRQESEKNMAVIRAMPIHVAVINRAGDFLFLNTEEEHRAQLGLVANRKINVSDVYGEDFARYIVSYIDLTGLSGMSFEIFYRYGGKDMRAVCSALSPELFGESALMFVSCDVSEIRDLEQRQALAMEQLRTNELMLRRAAESVRLSWFLGNDKREVIREHRSFVNWKFHEDGTRKEPEDVLVPEDIERFRTQMRGFFTHKVPEVHLVYHVDFDGEVRAFSLHMAWLDGRLFFGTVLDVTQMQRTENRMNLAHDFLYATIDNLPCFFWVKDVEDEFRYVLANRELCALLHLSPEMVVGRNDAEIWSDGDVSTFRKSDEDAARQGYCDAVEKFTDADGVVHRVHSFKRRVLISGREVLLGMAFDGEKFPFHVKSNPKNGRGNEAG